MHLSVAESIKAQRVSLDQPQVLHCLMALFSHSASLLMHLVLFWDIRSQRFGSLAASLCQVKCWFTSIG